MKNLFQERAPCQQLEAIPDLSGKLACLHTRIQESFPEISRISVILYDRQMNLMKTFIHSGHDIDLAAYTCSLDKAGSLREMAGLKQTRVVNDLSVFRKGKNRHTRAVAEQGFQSSLSLPLFSGTAFTGAVFFNSFSPNAFTGKAISRLSLYAQLINSLVAGQLIFSRMLVGAFRGALGMVSYKDPETGSHLERMARYARLIARHLAAAGQEDLDDETIEQIFLFAPLHDIGKIGIPDHILGKPGRLDNDEWEVMQTHSEKGRDIIDTIARHLGLTDMAQIRLLRDISGAHHETIDGKGYPDRLTREEIPIATQIVTVADIFDALTSQRPYKEAWPFDQALEELDRLAGTKLNPDCVTALKVNEEEAFVIRQRFQDGAGA